MSGDGGPSVYKTAIYGGILECAVRKKRGYSKYCYKFTPAQTAPDAPVERSRTRTNDGTEEKAMSERKIDAIDQLEIEIVEAGLDAWKANRRTECGSKLSSMACAWRAMTRVALAAPDAPVERFDDDTKGRTAK